MATNTDTEAIRAVDPDGHIEYFLSKVKARQTKATFQARRADVLDFGNWLYESPYAKADTVTEVDGRTIGDYIDSVAADGYAPTTVNRRYDSVRMFYGRLSGEYGIMEVDPFENITKRKFDNQLKGTKKSSELAETTVYVTPDEKEAIAENVPKPALRNELLVRLLWQTGARRGEVAKIRMDRIDREGRSVEVENIKKNDPDDPTRLVHYQPSLDMLLEQWMDAGYRESYPESQTSPYLFPGERGPAINPDDIGQMVRDSAIDAGVNEIMYEDRNGNERWKISAHALRHGHAVESLKSGIPLETIRRHMGHSDISMTQHYLQLVDDDVRKDMAHFGDYG